MSIYTFDGKQIKSVGFGAAASDHYYTSNLSDLAYLQNQAVVGNLSPYRAYLLVPWLFRAVTLRANQISRMPFILKVGGQEVETTAPEWKSILKKFKQRLWMIEAQLIIFGAAYELIEANALGHNITPRTLLSGFVTPRYDQTGLTGFQYNGTNESNIPPNIPLDKMLWWWRPNFSTEVLPGIGEAVNALGAASMLYALDAFTANFFNRGGVKVTVFEIPPSMSPADKTEFESWLQRAVSGVRNAFRMIAVRGGLKPTVIGSDIKESEAPELTKVQRDNVAVALGVPPSVIDGRSSDDSNSRSEKVAFITDTIIPEAELIFERYNEKFFSKFNAEIIPQPEKLDIMQTVQLEQAGVLKDLTGGKPVLTVNEARDWMGLEPMTETDAPEPMQPTQPDELPGADEAEQLPAPETPRALIEAATADGKAAEAEMNEWRRVALTRVGRAIGCPFDDELITCRKKADVRAVFESHWSEYRDAMSVTAIKLLTDEIAAATQALTIADAPPVEPVVVEMDVVDALVKLQPPGANIVVNLPRVKRQWSKVLRDSLGEMTGQVTEYEYEE